MVKANTVGFEKEAILAEVLSYPTADTKIFLGTDTEKRNIIGSYDQYKKKNLETTKIKLQEKIDQIEQQIVEIDNQLKEYK